MSTPTSWGYWQRTKTWRETVSASGTVVSNVSYSSWAWNGQTDAILVGNNGRHATVISGSSSSGVLSCWRYEYMGYVLPSSADLLRAYDDGSASAYASIYYAQPLAAARGASPETTSGANAVAANSASADWAEWDLTVKTVTYGVQLYVGTSSHSRYRSYTAATITVGGVSADGIALQIGVGGAWKSGVLAAVQVGGAWKNIAAVKIAVDGTWRDLV